MPALQPSSGLSATILLALLEECNPDASNIVAAYAILLLQYLVVVEAGVVRLDLYAVRAARRLELPTPLEVLDLRLAQRLEVLRRSARR